MSFLAGDNLNLIVRDWTILIVQFAVLITGARLRTKKTLDR